MTPTVGLLPYLGPLRLAGPVFNKELRAASRRPRSYGLRAGYVVLLMVLIVSAWCQAAAVQSTSPALNVSRLSYLGWYVTAFVVWFQFAAAQLVVAAILSASMGSEIRSGALNVLLTTPTTGLHIMLGKLLSSLLQVFQLLLVSLPILAVVRAFGGVSWAAVIACFCITITAAVFAGALSLLLSTYWHRPFDAISAGATVYLFLWVVVPAVATALAVTGWLGQGRTQTILDLTNPFRALYASGLWAPSLLSVRQGRTCSWLIHCLIMLGAAAPLLGLAAWRLRRTILGNPSCGRRHQEFMDGRENVPRAGMTGVGSRRWWRSGSLAIVAMALAVCIAILAADQAGLHGTRVYAFYFAWGLWTVALLRLTVSIAGTIAGEKESGAWSVLLTTPLNDDQILRGKATTGLRSNAVLLLSAQIVEICLLLSASVSSKVLSVGQTVLSAVASAFLIVAAGLYFGVRLKSPTTAIVATLGTYLCINYIVCGRYSPLFSWMFWSVLSSSRHQGTHLALLGFGMGGAALVLDATAGIFFVRQAVRTMRWSVF